MVHFISTYTSTTGTHKILQKILPALDKDESKINYAYSGTVHRYIDYSDKALAI